MWTLKFKAQPTNAFFATVNQMFEEDSLYCRAHGNQIVEHSSDNGTVFNSSWRLGRATKHLIDSGEGRICQLSFEF